MNYSRYCIAAGVWLIGGVVLAHADSVADKIGVSGVAAAGFPVGNDSVMDHTADVGHDFGGALRVGLTPHWSMSASYDNVNLYGKDGERHHPEVLLANALYHLNPEHKLVPTLQLGIGAGSTLSDGAFNKFSVRAGLGLDYFLCPNFSVGPQVNYTYIDSASGADLYHILAVGLGVNFFFDKPRDKQPAPAEASAPPPAVVAAPVVVPPPPVEENVSIELKVLFDSGKSVVKPEFHSEIQKVADFMDTYPQSTGEIQGHSDNTGAADMNKRLSQKRADAVRDFLITEFHIDPSRLTAVGYGEVGPVADNATAEGREENRRVIAKLHAVKIVHPNQ